MWQGCTCEMTPHMPANMAPCSSDSALRQSGACLIDIQIRASTSGSFTISGTIKDADTETKPSKGGLFSPPAELYAVGRWPPERIRRPPGHPLGLADRWARAKGQLLFIHAMGQTIQPGPQLTCDGKHCRQLHATQSRHLSRHSNPALRATPTAVEFA